MIYSLDLFFNSVDSFNFILFHLFFNSSISGFRLSRLNRWYPGIEAIGSLIPIPSVRKRGTINCPGLNCVSATSSLTAPELRSRLNLFVIFIGLHLLRYVASLSWHTRPVSGPNVPATETWRWLKERTFPGETLPLFRPDKNRRREKKVRYFEERPPLRPD